MTRDRTPGESFAQLFESENLAPRRRNFAPGDEIDVVVVQVGQNAVFVALDDKQEGFIEAKELTSESGQIAVKPGSMVRARVVELGGRPGAVRLTPISVREAEQDGLVDRPLGTATGPSVQTGGVTLMVGSHVRGKVALVERFGVFLQLDTSATQAQGGGQGGRGRGVRGLIPNSELGLPRGADAHRHFPVGKELEAKIVAIDERGRIRLSIAELAVDEERKAYEAFETKTKKADSEAPRRLATFGDLMAKFGSGAEAKRASAPASQNANKRKR